MADRIPPQNIDAEKSVLGAILLDKNAIIDVAEILRPEFFYHPVHGMVYEAILALFAKGEPVDILTLSNSLRKNKKLEKVGGAVYLTELAEAVPSSANAEYYALIVKDTYIRRSMITVGGSITELGFTENREIVELLDEAEKKLFDIANDGKRSDFVHIKELLLEAFEKSMDPDSKRDTIRGIPSGLKALDKVLGGFQESNLVIIAARPSVGKSALALDLARHAALHSKKSVGIFSLEMSNMELTDRLVAAEVGMNLWDYRMGNIHDDDTVSRLSDVMGELSEIELYLDDTPGQTIMEIRTKARRLSMDKGLDLLIVDYLQLIASGRNIDNRVQEVAEISKALKNLARELHIPVVALSQLSRAVETRTTKTPQLSDLRESGCLSGDSLIYIADFGGYRQIKDLVGKEGLHTLALNEQTKQLEIAPITNAFSTGIKQTYILETSLGRQIKATANHKFLTKNGWMRLDALEPGMTIALPRKTHTLKLQTMSNAQLGLLGHLIGDGCVLPRHVIQYTTNDITLAEMVANLATEAFGDQVKPRINKERTWYQVYLPAAYRLTHNKRSPITKWFMEMGIYGLRSYEKFIPDIVFAQPDKAIALFLKHLWSTDGCVHINNNSKVCHIYYATSSKRLADGVVSLLLKLGMNAFVRRVSQGNKGRDQYHIYVHGKKDMRIFLDKIGAIGYNKTKARLQMMQHYTNMDLLETANTFLDRPVYAYGVSRETKDQSFKLQPSYALVREVQYAYENDLLWDNVSHITNASEEEVFDISVENHHNFISQDVITHNSIEQDSDVVLFISRPEKDNPEFADKKVEDAEIIVAKHRNGPTGLAKIGFAKEFAHFVDVETRYQE